LYAGGIRFFAMMASSFERRGGFTDAWNRGTLIHMEIFENIWQRLSVKPPFGNDVSQAHLVV
jgi:hypothetical protein